MANDSLSDSYVHTMHFTSDAYKKHQRLVYIGSVMSQLLRQSYFLGHSCDRLTYPNALLEIAQFIEYGQRYSGLWDNLAFELQPVYDAETALLP